MFNQPFLCSQLHVVCVGSMIWEDLGEELRLAHGYYVHQSLSAGLSQLPRVCDGKGWTICTNVMVQAHHVLGAVQS